MMAFNADRASATMSMSAINQFRTLPPVPPNTFPENVTKIVFGSTNAEFDSDFAPMTTMKAIGMSV